MVIVLTGLWAVAILALGGNLRPDGIDWVRYLASVAGGGAVIWIVVYAMIRQPVAPGEKRVRPVVGVLEHRDDVPFDIGSPNQSPRKAPPVIEATVIEERSPVSKPGLRLSIRVALVVTALWAVLVFLLVYQAGFELGLYLFVTLTGGLLIFVVTDAIGRMTGWVVADPSRAWRRTIRFFLYVFIFLIALVVAAFIKGGFIELMRAIVRAP
jgi:hypothetical protein